MKVELTENQTEWKRHRQLQDLEPSFWENDGVSSRIWKCREVMGF